MLVPTCTSHRPSKTPAIYCCGGYITQVTQRRSVIHGLIHFIVDHGGNVVSFLLVFHEAQIHPSIHHVCVLPGYFKILDISCRNTQLVISCWCSSKQKTYIIHARYACSNLHNDKSPPPIETRHLYIDVVNKWHEWPSAGRSSTDWSTISYNTGA